jgi:molecular chaperone DnaJ
VGGGFFQQVFYQACPTCRGTGYQNTNPCKVCRGTGLQECEASQEVTIPPGVESGMTLVLRGAGHFGPWKGPAGDLLIEIEEVAHPHFTREGEHLVWETWMSYPDLVLGTSLSVPLLSGGNQTLKIPPGTPSGEVFELKGQGLPKGRSRQRGSLFVQVHVWVPKKLSTEERQSVEALRQHQAFQPSAAPRSESLLSRLRNFLRKNS